MPSDGDFDDYIRRQVRRTPLLWQATPYVIRKVLLRRHVKALSADLFFAPAFLGLFDDSFQTIMTVHDLVYRRFPQDTNPYMRRHLERTMPRDAHRCFALLADSEATKRDAVELLGVPAAKVHTVYLGVSNDFRPLDGDPSLDRVRQQYSLPDRFLLFVGTVEPRKNLIRLMQAFDALCQSPSFAHGLVIVGGKGWKDRPILDALRQCRAAERIVLTGHVPGPDLPVLYNLADVLVMPSLYEGFGLPVLEAMASGTPVVTSNVSSLPEVAGDAAVLVDPLSIESMVEGIRRLVTDAALRDDLKRRGLRRAAEFTWEKAARQALEIFERIG